MLSNARVAPTLAVTDMERARRFYEGKLSLEVEAVLAETIRYGCGAGTGLTLPSGVQRAFFKDPDGNIIGMRQL